MANSGAASGVDPEYSVYVGNLNPATTLSDVEDLIYELFLQAGPLDKVFIPYDRETGKHKGYGFVEFLHKESIQYSINLMNGICLLDRYLVVRTVTQRHQSSAQTPTNRNLPSLVSSTTTPGASKTIVEDNPFHSQAKPLVKITLPSPPSSATPLVPGVAASAIEGNPFLSPGTTSKAGGDNSFLSPAMPLIKVNTLPPPGSVSTGFSQQTLTPDPAAQLVQSTSSPAQLPTPLFPGAVRQQPVAAIASTSNPSTPNTPKVLPLNPFLEPNYSPMTAPTLANPFFQNLRCLPPPLPPPPPLELAPPFPPPPFLPPPGQTPPLAPPLFLPPPPLQQTPPLAPPPPVPLFPSTFNNSGGTSSIQSNSSSAQPLPLFPDISPSPSRQNDSPATTVQSDESATFDIATSFQTPPSTPDNEAIVQLSTSIHVPIDSHTSHSGSTMDIESEMDFKPNVNGDNDSWPQFSGGDCHERLHKGRIHANDHPAWLKGETKVKLAQYHLETLALELHKLKKCTNAS